MEAIIGRVDCEVIGVGGRGQIIKSHIYHFKISCSQHKIGE